MTVTAKWYGNGLIAAFNKEIDWNEANKIKVSLHGTSYAPDQDAHEYYDDVGDEVAESGTYAAGGMVLATPTMTYTAGTNVMKLDGDDCEWTGATITARYAVIRYDTGTAGTSPLIGYVDFGADVVSTAGSFKITWHTDGILKITAG